LDIFYDVTFLFIMLHYFLNHVEIHVCKNVLKKQQHVINE